MKNTIITNSFEETQSVGRDLAGKIGEARILTLYGDLGSGKTTFVQGLAKGLGIDKKIISPSFIIMREYNLERKTKNDKLKAITQGIKDFYHVDLYRINDEKAVEELGLIELMKDPENLFAIEWPEKIKALLPGDRIDIFFEYVDEDKRKIVF